MSDRFKVGDIVSNTHRHPDKTFMRAKVEAIAGDEVWVLAMTGPHEGGRLTFPETALWLVESVSE